MPDPAPPRKAPNRLNTAQRIQLADAVRQYATKFQDERPSMGAAAQYLSSRLGFSVSDDQVADACKACGILWKHKRPTSAGPRPRKYPALRDAVLALYAQLGIAPPANILPREDPA